METAKTTEKEESIGKKLKRLRTEKKWTQEQVANKLYISLSSYQKWEQDVGKPSAYHLDSFSKLYGISINYLLGNVVENNITNKEISEIIGLSEKAIETLKIMRETNCWDDVSIYNSKTIELIDFFLQNASDGYFELDAGGNKLVVHNIFRTMYEYFHFKVNDANCKEMYPDGLIDISQSEDDIGQYRKAEDVIVGYLENHLIDDLRECRKKYQEAMDKGLIK